MIAVLKCWLLALCSPNKRKWKSTRHFATKAQQDRPTQASLAAVATWKKIPPYQAKLADEAALRATVREIRIDEHWALGSAQHVRSTASFLTGPSKAAPRDVVRGWFAAHQGLMELARRSGQIRSISATAVYEGDQSEVRYGLHPDVTHRPNWTAPRTPAKIVGAYAVARVRTRTTRSSCLSRASRSRPPASAERPGPAARRLGTQPFCR